jgi:hypothetical protein
MRVVDTANANLDIAMARLNKADQDVKSLKPLAEVQAVPQQDCDNALAEHQAARADVVYRVTGVKTFVVGYDGVVYQKDLGPDTIEIAETIDATIRTRLGSAPTTSGPRMPGLPTPTRLNRKSAARISVGRIQARPRSGREDR